MEKAIHFLKIFCSCCWDDSVVALVSGWIVMYGDEIPSGLLCHPSMRPICYDHTLRLALKLLVSRSLKTIPGIPSPNEEFDILCVANNLSVYRFSYSRALSYE